MAESLELATAYVQFVAKGVDDVTSSISRVQKRLEEVTKAPLPTGPGRGFPTLPGLTSPGAGAGDVTQAGPSGVAAAMKGVESQAGRATEAMKQFGATGVVAGLAVASALKSFAQAGLEGTAQAAMLSFEMGQLARSVAAVFLPAIDAITDGIRRLTDWFRSLSETQQNTLEGLVIGLTAAKVAAMALGGPIGILVGVLAGLATAGGSGLGGLGEIFSGLMEAIKPLIDILGDALQEALEALRPLFDAVLEVFQALGPVVGVVAAAFGALMEVVRPLAGFVIELYTAFASMLADILRDMKPLFDQLAQAFREVGQAMRQLMSVVMPILRQAFSDMLEAMKPVVAFLLEEMVQAIIVVTNSLTYFIAELTVLIEYLKQFKESGDFTIFNPTQFAKDVQAAVDRIKAAAGEANAAVKGDKPGRALGLGGGHFEDITRQFIRIQEAPVGGGTTPEEETNVKLDVIINFLQEKFGGADINIPILGKLPPLGGFIPSFNPEG